MPDSDNELQTILKDVKTIKSILQNTDSPLPRVWQPAFVGGSAVAVIAFLQYFVPLFRDWTFDQKVLLLWLPGALLIAPVVLFLVYSNINKIGKGFLSQGRIRHLLYARFIIPPSALVLVYLFSRHPTFSLEGVCMVLIAMWQAFVIMVAPPAFRFVPLTFMFLGFAELFFGWTGNEIAFLNTLLTSAALLFVGFLFLTEERKSGV